MKNSTSINTNLAKYYLIVIFLVFILGNLLSSSTPISYKINGEWHFPIFTSENAKDYKDSKYEFSIWAPIPFESETIDLDNSGSKAPGALEKRTAGEFKHLLGTDHLGRDIAAGIIEGGQNISLILIGSISIALVFGILLGVLMGYFGDNKVRVTLDNLLLTILFIIAVCIHLSIGLNINSAISFFIWIGIIALFKYLLRRLKFKKIFLALDLSISRFIEIFSSIPTLILLIAIFAALEPGIFKVILILSVISWPGIAILTRSEILKEKNKAYIEAGISMGFSDIRLILKHILPNISGAIIIQLTYLAGALILLESALSFLGLGIPPDVSSWGKILALGKSQISAWWLVLFPGFFIFATVLALNTLGQHLGDQIKSGKQMFL